LAREYFLVNFDVCYRRLRNKCTRAHLKLLRIRIAKRV
jgi:hypothetical protein